MRDNKNVEWRKIWKQRDDALNTLEYHRVSKPKIKQISTLIISDLFDKSTKYFKMNKAEIKVRGYSFRFSVTYGRGWKNKTPTISVAVRCDCYHDYKPLVRAIAKELRGTLEGLFSQMDELIKSFVIGLIK
ncbi:MAG: hypothetical protein KAR08_05900 [Candidatus Heimdallarchaeota archaeon]|nr:hypothetical protein [Candidatus Heimdallarchaeota archaeon]